MNKISKIILAVALVMLTSVAKAQDKKNMFNPINTSVTSQTIAPDARAAGMGDVGVATDPDVVSQYWNPAKYPFTISPHGCDSWYLISTSPTSWATIALATIVPYLVLCAISLLVKCSPAALRMALTI